MSDLTERIEQLQKELDELREEAYKPRVRVNPGCLYFGRFFSGPTRQERRLLLITVDKFFAFDIHNGSMTHKGDCGTLPCLGETIKVSDVSYVFDERFSLYDREV